MKFKVGDKVKIIDDFWKKNDNHYLLQLKNKIFKVIEVKPYDKGIEKVLEECVRLDKGIATTDNIWWEGWLERVDEELEEQFVERVMNYLTCDKHGANAREHGKGKH